MLRFKMFVSTLKRVKISQLCICYNIFFIPAKFSFWNFLNISDLKPLYDDFKICELKCLKNFHTFNNEVGLT